jgi:membrane protein YdbS with pleckstrin-like domain
LIAETITTPFITATPESAMNPIAAEIVPISRRAFVIECILPMVAVLLVGGVAWRIQAVLPVDAKAIQILFVILAALTAPHMIIVEPFRFRGWRGPKNPIPELATGYKRENSLG